MLCPDNRVRLRKRDRMVTLVGTSTEARSLWVSFNHGEDLGDKFGKYAYVL